MNAEPFKAGEASPTAREDAPTAHSEPVYRRLENLREQLADERVRRAQIRAALSVAAGSTLLVGGEIASLATGLIDGSPCAAPRLLLVSSGASLVAGALAVGRVAHTTREALRNEPLLTTSTLYAIGLACITGVMAAFVAAWPS